MKNLDEAIKLTKKASTSKFPGSIDLHLAINLPKDKEAKSTKGSISLPHPVKTQESKIIVFCTKEDEAKAKRAGAVEAGLEKLIKKVQEGWMEFDVAIATPTVMAQIAVLGKQLGPKGLMPNPKTGTLTKDVKKTVAEFQKGKTKWACDEGAVVHISVGKVDSDDKLINENVLFVVKKVAEVVGKPIEGLLKSVHLSPTMGASTQVDLESFKD
ncbi:MAG: 50S ribosomal protein L1 [Patescibacteria group bacterium]|nr:50S ribosomal protein L1 [Patescibacteria group bacterium]